MEIIEYKIIINLGKNSKKDNRNLCIEPNLAMCLDGTLCQACGHLEYGIVLNSPLFSEHWRRNWMATCHFFHENCEFNEF